MAEDRFPVKTVSFEPLSTDRPKRSRSFAGRSRTASFVEVSWWRRQAIRVAMFGSIDGFDFSTICHCANRVTRLPHWLYSAPEPHGGNADQLWRAALANLTGVQPSFKEMHSAWSDLFLDLVFVGAAYQLGELLKASYYTCVPSVGQTQGDEYACVGGGVGLFYAMALFSSMQQVWATTTIWRAKYKEDDLVHWLLDVLALLLLILTAGGIKPVQFYLQATDKQDGMLRFLLPLWCCWLLWTVRMVEVATNGTVEMMRRDISHHLFDAVIILVVCWLPAILTLRSSTSTTSPRILAGYGIMLLPVEHLTAVVLLFIGAQWMTLSQAIRHLMRDCCKRVVRRTKVGRSSLLSS